MIFLIANTILILVFLVKTNVLLNANQYYRIQVYQNVHLNRMCRKLTQLIPNVLSCGLALRVEFVEIKISTPLSVTEV